MRSATIHPVALWGLLYFIAIRQAALPLAAAAIAIIGVRRLLRRRS